MKFRNIILLLIIGLLTIGYASASSSLPNFVNGQAPALNASNLNGIVNSFNNKSLNGQDFGMIGDGNTDNTAAFQAAINATMTNGGTLYVPAGNYLITGQINLPNNNATHAAQQNPLRLEGAGSSMSGQGTGAYGGTVLNMQFSAIYGKIVTQGLGLVTLSGITFMDSAGDSSPWIYTTNTVLHISDCSFIGSKTGTACDQDCIILGGITQNPSGALTSAFQGYGTVIQSNYFDHIRRAVYGRTYANGVIVRDNTIWADSGSNLVNGGAIEFDNPAVGANEYDAGNVISGNLIEIYQYPYGIVLGRCAQNSLIANNFYDATANISKAGVLFGTNSTTNYMLCGYCPINQSDDISTSSANIVQNTVHGYTISSRTQSGLNFNPSGSQHSFQMFDGYPGQYDGSFQIQQDGTTYLGGIGSGEFHWGGTPSAPLAAIGTSGELWTTGAFISSGNGSPAGALSRPIGSLYLRKDGGANTTLYVKESGTGNTGWVAK